MKEWEHREPNKVEDGGCQEEGGVRGSQRFRPSLIILLGSGTHATSMISARPFAQVMLRPCWDKTDRLFTKPCFSLTPSSYLIIFLFRFSTSIKY